MNPAASIRLINARLTAGAARLPGLADEVGPLTDPATVDLVIQGGALVKDTVTTSCANTAATTQAT
jgi:hypothetical protein